MTTVTAYAPDEDTVGHIAGIPVRNLWLLLLYASDLFRHVHNRGVAVEDSPDDIPDLVAEILAHLVELRIRRNLTYGYRSTEAILGRVRGRIDVLTTERRQLLARGSVACRFEDLTINTPRNRFIRAALDAIAGVVTRTELRHRCRTLAATFKRIGVSGELPSRTEMSTDRCGRHDADDRHMLAAAKLALDLMLPTEAAGGVSLAVPEREIVRVRKLFEKAVAGFYDVVLAPAGWRVSAGRTINWQIQAKTAGIDKILPMMQTDVVLDHQATQRRIVIDTKFTSILKRGWFRDYSLKSGYIYQIYAYLRSQEGNGDSLADRAAGLLLHPSIGEMVDETVTIQGHEIRFATVDLAASAAEIRIQLLRMANSEKAP